jgi:glycosyltransferase involved in cell wall biosynthesis
MRIGILLPTIFMSHRYGQGRIFAPGQLALSLADGLVDLGQEVTIYTSGDVQTKARVVAGEQALTDTDPTYFQFRYRDADERKYSEAEVIKRDFEYALTLRAYQDAKEGKLDIIHSYHDFGAHYFNELTKFPTVYTLHDPLPQTTDTIEYLRFKQFAHHNYVSISNSQRNSVLSLNFVDTIYHGVDLSLYDFQPQSGENLIHFGRIMEDKGTDVAIDVARRVGVPLILATSSAGANRSQGFFKEKIAPFIDNIHVAQVGFMEGKEKSTYIGGGKAFLFPLQWDEPFGMVMIEAMACGTPVIAYNHGSVSEIVQDGVTGFIVNPDDTDRSSKEKWKIQKTGIAGLVEAVQRIGELDRSASRAHVEHHFTTAQTTQKYLSVYKKVLEKTA